MSYSINKGNNPKTEYIKKKTFAIINLFAVGKLFAAYVDVLGQQFYNGKVRFVALSSNLKYTRKRRKNLRDLTPVMNK